MMRTSTPRVWWSVLKRRCDETGQLNFTEGNGANEEGPAGTFVPFVGFRETVAMIYYDTTKMGAAKHRSGLTRVSGRLREELGGTVTPVVWDGKRRAFVSDVLRQPVVFAPADCLFT